MKIPESWQPLANRNKCKTEFQFAWSLAPPRTFYDLLQPVSWYQYHQGHLCDIVLSDEVDRLSSHREGEDDDLEDGSVRGL